MATKSGNATALTVLSPIKNGILNQVSFADITRERCLRLPIHEKSPLSKVPNTYLARLFILDDVYYESLPANDKVFNFSDITSLFSDSARKKALPRKDHLKSKYLVFSSSFYGDLDEYLRGMWDNWSYVDHEGNQRDVRHIWEYCVAFDRVTDSAGFIHYIKRCQLDASLFFNGSTDDSLQDQLKALYLKQEFTRFAVEHQGKGAAEIQQAFKAFIERAQPENLASPTWPPGKSTP
ncbi:hypothetical protein SAMN05421690_10208 [Nitrosomonas sp. Nm51]|uniref:hypothetical protein n=1 Tax=Nitrosomonas sp. Nm51 TaxID=133720 RepID=UPI0008D1B4A5|nr:hypothetical protein [Nitrosomonas sp. Nm51]SER33890.1 hypothetical protein SAMN05421690_10208 [Nitrosomonas sp. Nm51]